MLGGLQEKAGDAIGSGHCRAQQMPVAHLTLLAFSYFRVVGSCGWQAKEPPLAL